MNGTQKFVRLQIFCSLFVVATAFLFKFVPIILTFFLPIKVIVMSIGFFFFMIMVVYIVKWSTQEKEKTDD